MRFLFLNIIFISIFLPQTSSISMYGFGEFINTYDASSIALGDSKFFGGYKNKINFSSPSSYWKSEFSNLMVSISTNYNTFSNEDLVENSFKMLSFTFPVDENKICGFGMNPLFRTDMDIIESDYKKIGADQSPTGSPIAYKTDYSFKGGISEFFILYSSKLSNHVSFGARWSKLFGTSKNKYYLSQYDLIYDDDLIENFTDSSEDLFIDNLKYSSNKYLLEVRMEYQKIDGVISYAKTNTLNLEYNPYICGEYNDSDCENYYSILNLDDINKEFYNLNNNLSEFGLGIEYVLNPRVGIVIEHHNIEQFVSYEFLNIFGQNNPEIQSNHFGLYYKFNNGIDSSINESIIKFGLYSKTNKVNNYDFHDRGITFGFGFNYFKKKNFIDFSFKIGSRTTEYELLNDEKYYTLMITLISGERWFINERKK